MPALTTDACCDAAAVAAQHAKQEEEEEEAEAEAEAEVVVVVMVVVVEKGDEMEGGAICWRMRVCRI